LRKTPLRLARYRLDGPPAAKAAGERLRGLPVRRTGGSDEVA